MMTNRTFVGMSREECGFTIVETIVALGLLSISLLSLAAVFGQGMKLIGGSSGDAIMTQKATEAVENVFTARDTRVLTWSQIRNVNGDGISSGGIFKDGPKPLKLTGPDGLINTADDDAQPIETMTLPGRDNMLGTPDDEVVTLNGYTREIEIRDLSPGLRRIRVIVTYQDGSSTRRFELLSYISTYA